MTRPIDERDIFSRIVLGSPTPKRMATSMVSTPPSASVSRRWGTVDAITGDTLSINVGGIVVPGVRRVANYAPTVGETVMLDVVGGDLVVVNTLAPSPKNDLGQVASDMAAMNEALYVSRLATRMQFNLTGGGSHGVGGALTAPTLKWNERFIAISMQKSPTRVRDGFFEIGMPPAGTVITGHSGSTNVTVSGDGWLQLPGWASLWYIPPWGQGPGTVYGNFRITQYEGHVTQPLDIPEDWILIATSNSDAYSSAIKWGDGSFGDVWRGLGLINGWSIYGSDFPLPAVKKLGSEVHLQGLIKNEAPVGEQIITNDVPAGFRPDATQLHFPVSANNAYAGIGVYGDGRIQYKTGSGAWFDLGGVSWTAYQ